MFNGNGILFWCVTGGLVSCCVFGIITMIMNENKGYKGGFAWGFWLNLIGVIVVACKPDSHSGPNTDGNVSVSGQSVADEIRKYKALADDGIITEDEFQAKKKQLLEQI